MFKCDKCGLCCRNLKKSPIYKELDRGDGVCKYYDIDSKLCTIYSKRPLICNIDQSYYSYFQTLLSLDKYYELNYEVCKKLKKEDQK